jgi:hypothetical protein
MNPFVTPLTWRAFLYNDVLLPRETESVRIRPEAYSKKALADEVGLHVARKNKLAEMRTVEAAYRRHPGEFLVFYADGKGYESLFKRLRDTVAHAHYTGGRSGWITMHHQFKGRGEAKPTVRLMARIRFATLRSLVQFLNPLRR